jgi:hypothetical protein
MNLDRLKDIESEFLEQFPEGFEDANFFPTMKKSKPKKLTEFAREVLAKEKFSNPSEVIDGFFKTVQKSNMVSLFDKLKLRDMINTLNSYEKDMLSIELYEFLYGDKKQGFEGLVEFLAEYQLAKWTIISVVPYTLNREKAYFIKPTTTKNIIKYLELKDLIYKPRPSFEFYTNYTKALDKMKSKVDKSLRGDNGAFTGFLRVGIEICEE